MPLVLAQNEIEPIGLEQQSRLNLLDGFSRDLSAQPDTGDLVSLETEIVASRREIRELDEQLAAHAPLVQELSEARKQLAVHASQSQQIGTLTTKLKEVNERLRPLIEQRQHLTEYRSSLQKWLEALLQHIKRFPAVRELTNGLSAERFKSITTSLQSGRKSLVESTDILKGSLGDLNELLATCETDISNLEEQSRPLRAKIDELNKSAGEISRRVSLLERKVSEGEAIASLREQRLGELRKHLDQRDNRFSSFERSRANRSVERKQTASLLNAG